MLTRNERYFTIKTPFGTTTRKTQLDNIHYAAIREYSPRYMGGKYLEIGTSYGHSAYQAWMAMRPSKMVLCDTFEAKEMIPYIERTLVNIGCTSDVVFMVGSSHDTLKHIQDKFDFILVDGDHSYSGAKKDLLEAWDMLVSGGTMLFDDINIRRLKVALMDFIKEKDDVIYSTYDEWKSGVAALRKDI